MSQYCNNNAKDPKREGKLADLGSSLVFIKIPNANFNLNGELDLIRRVSTGNRTREIRMHVAAQLGFKRKIQSGRKAMNIWKS